MFKVVELFGHSGLVGARMPTPPAPLFVVFGVAGDETGVTMMV